MRSLSLSLLLLATLLFHGILTFKDKEFKTCKDAGFCRRNRGLAVHSFKVEPKSVRAAGPSVSGLLVNEQAPGCTKSLAWSLVAHKGGFARLLVDEEPGVGRYRINDILEQDVQKAKADWSQQGGDASGSVFTSGHLSVAITYQPFRMAFSIDGKPAVTLNSRDMFQFEHRRTKEESPPETCDGCWEETFLSHQDSKPKGPEAISLDISFPDFDHVYGIPEHAVSHSLKTTSQLGGEPYRMYNLDVFEYALDHPFGLYGSIPFMLAHKVGLTTGVFWLNAAEMYIDLIKESGGMASQWIAESGIVDLFVFAGPTPEDVVKQYSSLTGTTALPQLFSIGYHQCRWNYKDEADVAAVSAGFDDNEMPMDVVWLDIDHTNGKRYMTWDAQHFPNPKDMQENLGERGRKLVTIIDPHVKREHTYPMFTEAESKHYYVLDKEGKDFNGWCWPGHSSYLDVTNAVVRDWWANQFYLEKYEGSTKHLYIWNDMNEPSVFNGPEVTFPKDNLHEGGVEHRSVHNRYGLDYHQATADGLYRRGYKIHGPDGDRPFVLSRAFFPGTQRVGPIWTGDNFAKWDHLRMSVPMLLTLGVTGLPNSGADVAGFFGNPEPELMVRWNQLAVFYPFFRGHAHLESPRREPWLFGEPFTTHLRNAIRSRYALLPYMYTLFRHANLTGVPILRPLWYEFPDNKDTFDLDSQLMLGPGMLVSPVMTPEATSIDVLLPRAARWYNAHTGAEVERSSSWLSSRGDKQRVAVTIDTIPVFYRGGNIVPRRERPRRAANMMLDDPVTLMVALDAGSKAFGDLYLDDGHSFAFKRGLYVHRTFSFDGSNLVSTPTPQAANTPPGVLQLPVTVERVVFMGLPNKAAYQAKLPTGQVVDLEMEPISVYAPRAMSAHVLRKPDLPISNDWTVEVFAKK